MRDTEVEQPGGDMLWCHKLRCAVAASQAVDRQLDLGRSLQVWLSLQNGVNALFDSTSTSQNLGTQVAYPLCHSRGWMAIPV